MPRNSESADPTELPGNSVQLGRGQTLEREDQSSPALPEWHGREGEDSLSGSY
jgi:hypothetical protein